MPCRQVGHFSLNVVAWKRVCAFVAGGQWVPVLIVCGYAPCGADVLNAVTPFLRAIWLKCRLLIFIFEDYGNGNKKLQQNYSKPVFYLFSIPYCFIYIVNIIACFRQKRGRNWQKCKENAVWKAVNKATNQKVGGSNPSGATRFKANPQGSPCGLFF